MCVISQYGLKKSVVLNSFEEKSCFDDLIIHQVNFVTSSGYTINATKAGFIVGQATAVVLIKRLFVL